MRVRRRAAHQDQPVVRDGRDRIRPALLGGSASRGWRLAGRSAIVVVAVGVVPSVFGAARVGAAQTTALAMQVGSPARAVHESDGREHVDYDLVIANAFTVPVRLESLRVFSGARLVFALRGRVLAEQTLTLAGTPTATIPISSVVKTLVDVILPRSFGASGAEALDRAAALCPPSRRARKNDHRQHRHPRADRTGRPGSADPDRVAVVRSGVAEQQRLLRGSDLRAPDSVTTERWVVPNTGDVRDRLDSGGRRVVLRG